MAEIHWTKTEATIAGEPHLSYAADIKGDGYMVRRVRTAGRTVWIATKRCERIGGGFATSDEAIEACHAVAGVKRHPAPPPASRAERPAMSAPLDRSIFNCQHCHEAPAQHLHLANGLRLCDRCSGLERRRVWTRPEETGGSRAA